MIGALVTATVAMLAVAVLAFWTARRGATGTLPRNDLIGIRTATTRASDDAWRAAHRAGAADLRRSGYGAGATALLPWAALALPEPVREPAIAVVVLAGVAVLIGFTVRAGVVGQRAAREVTSQR